MIVVVEVDVVMMVGTVEVVVVVVEVIVLLLVVVVYFQFIACSITSNRTWNKYDMNFLIFSYYTMLMSSYNYSNLLHWFVYINKSDFLDTEKNCFFFGDLKKRFSENP